MIRPGVPGPTRPSEDARTESIPVPRPDGGVRWITRLGPEDFSLYDSVVSHMTPTIERALGPEVLANRAMGRGAMRTTRLEPWRPARVHWRSALTAALAVRSGPAVLIADVRECYASIRPAVLARRLMTLGADPGEIAGLRELLERFGEDGVRGLPIGPAPSAILANAVLSVVDEGFRETGIAHVRWVDDVVAPVDGRRQARIAFDAFRRGLDEVGLEPSPSKTAILTGRDQVRERLLNLRPSTGGVSRVR